MSRVAGRRLLLFQTIPGSVNYFLVCDNFCHLLISFVNSLDPDLDPNCLNTDSVPERGMLALSLLTTTFVIC